MQHKVPTVRSYLIVFSCLIVLTLVTTATANAPIGHLHTPIGLAIATGKALLVIAFFMHLLHSDRISWIMMAAAMFMLFVLLYLTLADYWTRIWMKT
jgi:cytochrome c oxidase subunit 4